MSDETHESQVEQIQSIAERLKQIEHDLILCRQEGREVTSVTLEGGRTIALPEAWHGTEIQALVERGLEAERTELWAQLRQLVGQEQAAIINHSS